MNHLPSSQRAGGTGNGIYGPTSSGGLSTAGCGPAAVVDLRSSGSKQCSKVGINRRFSPPFRYKDEISQ